MAGSTSASGPASGSGPASSSGPFPTGSQAAGPVVEQWVKDSVASNKQPKEEKKEKKTGQKDNLDYAVGPEEGRPGPYDELFRGDLSRLSGPTY